jgi:hypothetical protein
MTIEQLKRRLRCWLTLNHIDPGVRLVGQRMYVCKACGKVLKP